MDKILEITPKYCKNIPKELEHGILYISKKHEVAIHLCACGCMRKTVTSLWEGHWTLTEKDGLVTLRPSIGNFIGESPYHAHYFVTKNKIDWL